MSTPRLEAARAELRRVRNADAALAAELDRLRQQGEPATRDTGARAALHQQRRSIFASVLRLGRPLTEADGALAVLDDQEAEAQRRADRAQAAAEALHEAMADVEAKRVLLGQRAAAAQREIVEAAYEAACLEVEHAAIPELLSALEALREALGRCYGACLARDRLHKQAVAGLAWLEPIPMLRSVTLALPGIDIADRLRGRAGMQVLGYTEAQLDAGAIVEDVAAEVVARLSAQEPAAAVQRRGSRAG